MRQRTSNARPTWRERQNSAALEHLLATLPEPFPDAVWRHALVMRFIPETLSDAVAAYWHARPLRADRLARALAARSGAPEGWSWTLDVDRRDRLPVHFRTPPAPYREHAFSRGAGYCCMCGQPVYRYGWHRDLWQDGKPRLRATWHQACVKAWKLWTAPHQYAPLLRRTQRLRCAATGKRLLRTSHVDHRVPLSVVWLEHRTTAWPEILRFWGPENLQVLNREAHIAKSAGETKARSARKPSGP
jgi:hypothetical protein